MILVLSDQHRWHAMSFTETPEVRTPELARMAQEGFSADRFVSNYPLCSPARALLFSGRWPWQTGVEDNRTRTEYNLPPAESTLGRLFSDAGYETAYIGKWHLGGDSKGLAPFGYGESIVWMNTNEHFESRYLDANGARVESRRYNATHMTDQLLELLARPREAPLFATLAWNVPHANYLDAPPTLRALYPDETSLPVRANWRPQPGFTPEEIAGSLLLYRGYHAHVTALDAELGRIRRQLAEQGIERETIVVYVSDHGAMLHSHALQGKRVPYSESVRVPFLVVWPGRVAAGGRSTAPLSLVDVVPTLAGLVGLDPPPGDGVDFSPLLFGDTEALPQSQLIMNMAAKPPRQGARPGMRADRYRGVVTAEHTYAVTPEGPWLLFDDRADPLQLENRIDDPALADTRAHLHALLLGWLRRSGDPFLEDVAAAPR